MTGLWKHPDVEWLAASPDRIVKDKTLLEVKTTTRVAPPTPAFLIQITIQLACTRMNECDLVQFSYKSKQLRIDKVRYDADVFTKIYELLAPVAASAAEARAAAQLPEPPENKAQDEFFAHILPVIAPLLLIRWQSVDFCDVINKRGAIFHPTAQFDEWLGCMCMVPRKL